jgi:hypothetical protein
VRKSRRMGECIYAFTVNLNARSLSGAFLGRKIVHIEIAI